MRWEAPSFTRIPTGTELGYTNELERKDVAAREPAPKRPARTAPRAR